MFKKLCFRVIANTPSRLVFFSRCRLLPPREIAKSFSANGMVGRGGGDRTLYPLNIQCFQRLAMKRARALFIHSKRLGLTQAGDCRRVSPRKTNKSLHYRKM